MYRVRVTWTGVVVAGGGLSTFYMNGASGAEADCVDLVGDLLDSIGTRLNNNVSWATEPDVDSLDPATGTLTGSGTATPRSGTGGSATEALPQATQGLARLRTGSIVSGRELRGRLFIPAMTEADSSGGGVLAAAVTAFNTALATAAARSDVAWVVWSRTHGTTADITSATMWTKFAVLRSRRD